MNAISKGVSIGLYDAAKQTGVEASRGGAQPYVDLMGRRYVSQNCTAPPRSPAHARHPFHMPPRLPYTPRAQTECTLRLLDRIGAAPHAWRPSSLQHADAPHRPLYQTASGRWRALAHGSPVAPASAYAYVARALRQTAPAVLGALRLLAASFAPAELNARGFALYAALMRYDNDGTIEPYLAESLEPNEDATEGTLVLKEGLTFHDDSPVDSEAGVYSLKRILDPLS